MRKIVLFFIAISTLMASSAQTPPPYSVSGSIADNQSIPIIGAVVELSFSDNNTPVSVAVTNVEGEFLLQQVPEGEFTLTVQHLTYLSQTIPCSVAGNIKLPTMVLEENIYVIDQLIVSPENIVQSADRYKIALRNDPITQGKTASEVLDFLPAVSSHEEDLRIFGQAVSRIRINGVLIQDRKELAAIQADNIDNVEVVYISGVNDMTPGVGGEINIQLKKIRDGGFYGSVAANTTMNFKYGNTFNGVNSSFNYGYKKWSVYNYLGFNYNNHFSDQQYLVRYFNTGETNNQQDRTRGWNNYFSDRLSITYDINNSHMLGVNLQYSRSNNEPEFKSQSIFTDNFGSELDRSLSQYNASILNNQYQATLHYKWKINDKGAEFNMRGDYLRYETDTDYDYTNTYQVGQAGENIQYMNQDMGNNVDLYYVESKLTHNVGKMGKFEAGINYNGNRTHQILSYTDLIGGIWMPNVDLSDDYRLQGDNYAAFASLSSTIGEKISYQLGLRGERRQMSYNSMELNLKNKKNYNVLAVQANLMYMLNPQKGRMLMFAYARGANDIPYSAITPVVTYLDEYTYLKGNVDLNPTTYDMAMLNLMLNKNWTFRVAGGVSNNMQYNGVFTDEADPRVTYTMPINTGRSLAGNVYAEYNFKVLKWWNVSANVQWEVMKTDSPDGKFTRNKWLFNVKNNFNWNKGWGGTLNFYYEPANQPYANRKLKTELDLVGNIYKTLLDNKLRINMQTLFFNITRDNITFNPDIWRKFYNDKHRYNARLSLTYNFSGGKKVNVKQINSGQSYNETLKTTKE